MSSRLFVNNRGLTGSAALLATLVLTAGSLVAWKRASARRADAAAARQPEPVESVTLAVAREHQYRPTTTSVGTILALNSVTLRNELPGTVRRPRGSLRRASRAIPERRHRAHHAAGGRRRGQRGLHGGTGGGGRAAPGRSGRRVRGRRRSSVDGPNRRGRCENRSGDPQCIGAGPDPEPCPGAGRLGARRSPRRSPDDGRRDSGERPPEGAGR